MAAGNASGFALGNSHEVELSWVVEGPPSASASLTVAADFDRAGTVEVVVPLGPKAAL